MSSELFISVFMPSKYYFIQKQGLIVPNFDLFVIHSLNLCYPSLLQAVFFLAAWTKHIDIMIK